MMKLHIYEYLKNYCGQNPIRLHMPAHKGKEILPNLFSCYDVTELDGENVVTALQKAERDLAEILGAKYLRIKSDGASMCIISAIHSVRNLGDSLIVNRTAHKSVYNAVKTFGINPIIIDNAEDILSLDLGDKRLIGAMLTYPDYYGNTFDIERVANALKGKGKLLLIDNSHGGHYNFFEGVTYAGRFADIWVDSAHKVFATLNQGAMLVCNNEKLIDELDCSAEIFCTTSPSYPILASVEYGVKFMLENGEKMARYFSLINEVKNTLEREGIALIKNADPYKICVDCGRSKLNAKKTAQELMEKGIFYELNDGNNIVFMPSIMTDKAELERLIDFFKEAKITCQSTKNDKGCHYFGYENCRGVRKIDYLSACNGKSELTQLSRAVGKISADNVGVFPPCYPVITAGEQITQTAVDLLLESEGVFGLVNGKIKTIIEG